MDSPSARRDIPRPPPIVCISPAIAVSSPVFPFLPYLPSAPLSASQKWAPLHFSFHEPLPATPAYQLSEPLMSSRLAWREPLKEDFRHERTSSSSSDSGVGVQFSPLIGGTTAIGQSPTLSAFSPPGLSPLTIHDSAFSTPTSITNRFTFDHVPFSRSEKNSLGSAFDVPSTSKDNLRDVLASVRHEGNRHAPLQRKESVIQSTRALALGAVLSDPQPRLGKLTVTVPDQTLDQFKIKGLLGTLYQPQNGHNLLAPSRSSDSVLHSPLQVSPLSEKSPLSGASTETLDEDDKKQYYCQICKKDFKRPDILSRHLRRHTGEKPFGCESCGRFFSRSDHLRTHRRTHTDEKPYHCDVCPYSARRRDVLTRHMNTRHQTKASPSIFQRHREIRRCLSDGDPLLNSLGMVPSSEGTSKRVRHATDIQTGTGMTRERTLTEFTRKENDETFPSLAEIEDDVIVDIEDGEEDEDDDA